MRDWWRYVTFCATVLLSITIFAWMFELHNWVMERLEG